MRVSSLRPLRFRIFRFIHRVGLSRLTVLSTSDNKPDDKCPIMVEQSTVCCHLLRHSVVYMCNFILYTYRLKAATINLISAASGI